MWLSFIPAPFRRPRENLPGFIVRQTLTFGRFARNNGGAVESGRLRPQLQRLRPQLQRLRPQLQRLYPQLQRLRPQLQRLRPQLQRLRPDVRVTTMNGRACFDCREGAVARAREWRHPIFVKIGKEPLENAPKSTVLSSDNSSGPILGKIPQRLKPR